VTRYYGYALGLGSRRCCSTSVIQRDQFSNQYPDDYDRATIRAVYYDGHDFR
jgi:hypothetical protein